MTIFPLAHQTLSEMSWALKVWGGQGAAPHLLCGQLNLQDTYDIKPYQNCVNSSLPVKVIGPGDKGCKGDTLDDDDDVLALKGLAT